MRRRLRDVQARLSGVLPVLRDEPGTDGPEAPEGAERPEQSWAPPEAADPSESQPDPAHPAAPDVANEEPPVPVTTPEAPPAAVEPDALLAAAVDVAREAAVELGGPKVGDHLGAVAEGDPLVVTHAFASTDPAYVGWQWDVTVARAEGSDRVTVDEVVLVPGGAAILPPPWVPWSERVRPSDIGPGDLLPLDEDDERVVPSYADLDGPDLLHELDQPGLGKPRRLSREGRLDAATRWYTSDQGPESPLARQAPARCVTCAFWVSLTGPLSRLFGVCANGKAPDDARVTSLDHGCGAHSDVVAVGPPVEVGGLAVPEEAFEAVALDRARPAGSVDDADPAEPLGHS